MNPSTRGDFRFESESTAIARLSIFLAISGLAHIALLYLVEIPWDKPISPGLAVNAPLAVQLMRRSRSPAPDETLSVPPDNEAAPLPENNTIRQSRKPDRPGKAEPLPPLSETRPEVLREPTISAPRGQRASEAPEEDAADESAHTAKQPPGSRPSLEQIRRSTRKFADRMTQDDAMTDRESLVFDPDLRRKLTQARREQQQRGGRQQGLPAPGAIDTLSTQDGRTIVRVDGRCWSIPVDENDGPFDISLILPVPDCPGVKTRPMFSDMPGF